MQAITQKYCVLPLLHTNITQVSKSHDKAYVMQYNIRQKVHPTQPHRHTISSPQRCRKFSPVFNYLHRCCRKKGWSYSSYYPSLSFPFLSFPFFSVLGLRVPWPYISHSHKRQQPFLLLLLVFGIIRSSPEKNVSQVGSLLTHPFYWLSLTPFHVQGNMDGFLLHMLCMTFTLVNSLPNIRLCNAMQ